MNEITEKEIEQISLDIDQQGLTYVELKNEILDHICCQVEVEMEQGVMFNDAFRKVKEELGKKRIRQIQHETLNLISKKYRRMKRIMYAMGVIAPALVIIASLFKLMHWPGAGIMLTLGLFLVGMVFLPAFVMTRIRDTRKQGEALPEGLYITGMIAGMLSIIGALFKIMHWPGASVLLTLGLVSFSLIFLPMYASVKFKEAKTNNEPVDKGLIIGGIIAGIFFVLGALFKIMHWPGAGIVIFLSWSIVGVIFLPMLVLNQLKKSTNQTNRFFSILVVATGAAVFIMSLTRSEARFDSFSYYDLEAEHTTTAAYFETQSNTLLKAGSETLPSEIVSFCEKSDELDQHLEELKIDLLSNLAGDDKEIYKNDGTLDYLSTIGTNSYRNYAFHHFNEGEGFDLEDKIIEFSRTASGITLNTDLRALINDKFTLDMSEVREEEKIDYWFRFYFTGPVMATISKLSMLQSSIRMVESEILEEQY